jgi:hypothetical protein
VLAVRIIVDTVMRTQVSYEESVFYYLSYCQVVKNDIISRPDWIC